MSLYMHTYTHARTHRSTFNSHVQLRQGSLMESPGCQTNSVTFEVMLSTHYSTGQMREEEEQWNGNMETLNT